MDMQKHSAPSEVKCKKKRLKKLKMAKKKSEAKISDNSDIPQAYQEEKEYDL